jgi:hypothetical protein
LGDNRIKVNEICSHKNRFGGLYNKLGISSVVADGLFGLVFSDNTAAYFLLEMDRGSMPVARSRFDQTSFKRKLVVYWEAWKQGRHVEHFGLKLVRVLTVTEGAERADRMVDLVFDLTGGRGSSFLPLGHHTDHRLINVQPVEGGPDHREINQSRDKPEHGPAGVKP